MNEIGFKVITKPVKMIHLSLNVSSLPTPTSLDILKDFVSPHILRKLKVENIEYLNNCLGELNKQGIYKIEHMKCNFDVEIGTHMLVDNIVHGIETYSLWSGDSDFADPLSQLLREGRRVALFATARKVATELSELRGSGLLIYDIRKIKEFLQSHSA